MTAVMPFNLQIATQKNEQEIILDNDSIPSPKSGFYGWKNATLLFFIYFITMGLVFYAYSVIFPAMIKSLGWSRGDASIAHTINSLLVGFLGPIASLVINRYGTRKTMFIGLIVLIVSLSLLGTVTSQLWQWTVIWGVFVPVGFCFVGVLPIQTTVNFWFNLKRATVIGIVMSGAPLGGFIAQPVYTWLMLRTKTWQTGWLTGLFFSLLCLVLIYFVRNKPEDLGQCPDGLDPVEARLIENGQGQVRTYRTTDTWTVREVLHTPAMWFITILFISQVVPVFMMVTHGVLHLTDMGLDKMQAASVMGFMLLGTALARFPMGWLGDRINPRWIVVGAMMARLIVFIGIWQLSYYPALMILAFIFGFTYGTTLVLLSSLVANYFGSNVFASIFGFLMPIWVFMGAVIPVGAGYIHDYFNTYDIAFIGANVIIALGLIGSLLLKPPRKKANKTKRVTIDS